MTISNRLSGIPKIVGKNFQVGTAIVKLCGTNLAYLAIKGDPKKIVEQMASKGYNWFRLHHIDGLIRRGELTVEEVLAFADVLQAAGMVFSLDGISDYKAYPFNSLYQEQNETDYAGYLRKIGEILRHPACLYINLVNENFTNLKNAGLTSKIPGFYAKWKAFLKDEIGFKGYVTDGGDANIDPPHFAPLMKDFDLVVGHAYGTHPENGRWHAEDWKFRGELLGVSAWLAGMVSGPMLMQEWGCLPFDDYRGVNGAFALNEFVKRFAGFASYQWASNQAQMRGEYSQVDDYSICTDYPRAVTEVLAAALVKYDKRIEKDYYWGHVQSVSKKDTNYRRITNEVITNLSYGQGKVIVKVSSKKLLVFLFDETRIRGYQKVDEAYKGGTWSKTTNRGGKQVGFWDGQFVDLGAEVSGAYRLDPWKLSQVGTMVKSGTGFIADRSCAVYSVNLR
jgi:hypothetical protein